MKKYILGIACLVFAVGFYIALIKESPVETKNTTTTELDAISAYTPGSGAITDVFNTVDPNDPYEPLPIVEGYVKTAGLAANGEWYPIKVDTKGYIILNPTPIDFTVKSSDKLLDARAWGYYYSTKHEDPDQFRKIRVDEWGRVICAPNSVITVEVLPQ